MNNLLTYIPIPYYINRDSDTSLSDIILLAIIICLILSFMKNEK